MCFKKIKEYLGQNFINLFFLIFSLTFFIVVISMVGANFFGRLSVELCEGFKNDGGIYYAVGKGIAHGMRPYIDMYETKGPVLFYLCALAYKISPNFIFMNILSFLSLLTIIIAPAVVITIKFFKRKKRDILLYLTYLLFAFTFTLLLAAYTENATGRIYAEMFGLGFLTIYFSIIFLVDSKRAKIISPSIIVASFFLMLAMFIKETFIAVSVVGMLFICRNRKDYIYKFFVPTIYAGLIAIIFMGCAGILPAYFNIYIRSIIERPIDTSTVSNAVAIPNMFRVDITLLSIWNFSEILAILVLGLFAVSFYWLFTQPYFKSKSKSGITKKISIILDLLRRVVLALAAFFVTTFCLSLGTMRWDHLKAVGIPLYILLLYIAFDVLYSRERIKIPKTDLKINSAISFLLTIFTCFGVLMVQTFIYSNRTYETEIAEAKIQAKYVDKICDALNEERYQYMGMIKNSFYAYTKHEALGPAFIQTNPMFSYENNYLCKQFIVQIQAVNIIFVRVYQCGAINDWVKYYINQNFTTEVPEQCEDIIVPDSWRGITYFRTNKFN